MKVRKLTNIQIGILLGVITGIVIGDVLYLFTNETVFFLIVVIGALFGIAIGVYMNRSKKDKSGLK